MHPLTKHRNDGSRLDVLLAHIRDARFGDGVRCPRCGSDHVQLWGTFSGRQRYRCRGGCGRTFSDLTGTAAAYIKKLDHWAAHAECLDEGFPLREVAQRLGVHISTAFRWRHRVLEGLAGQGDEPLTGWIELYGEPFEESRKGARSLDRPARRSGKPLYLVDQFPHRTVVVAADRAGHVVTALLRDGRINVSSLESALGTQIQACVALSSMQLPVASCLRFAQGLAADFRPPGVRRGGSRLEPRAHVKTAWAYGRRLRQWMVRFRGVATRYLPNYLRWHRRWDLRCRQSLEVQVLSWPQGP